MEWTTATMWAAPLGLAALALSGSAALAQAPDLRVDHAAARVVVTPEARGDLDVTVSRGDPRLPPLTVRRQGREIIVEGGLDDRHLDCGGSYNAAKMFGGKVVYSLDSRRVKIPGVGWVDVRNLPVITVHAPAAAAVAATGAVWGEVGPAETLNLRAVGCGDWGIGPVRGKLAVHMTGSGDLRGQSVGALALYIAGSGDTTLARVNGPAAIEVAGSGDVHLGAVAGALEARLAGSGDLTADSVGSGVQAELAGSSNLTIKGGHASQVAVQISGSGDFVLNGSAGAVSAVVNGSGDVHIAHADGPVSKSVSGSGTISVGR